MGVGLTPTTSPVRTPQRTHGINFRLRLQLFENGVIDYKLQITITIETFSGVNNNEKTEATSHVSLKLSSIDTIAWSTSC